MRLRWAIIGSGKIASKFASGIGKSSHGELVAVGSRNPDQAQRTSTVHFPGNPQFVSYEEVIRLPEVDAVYIAVPHPWHAEWSNRSLDAGKHVLCEKPMTMSHADAQGVIAKARKLKLTFLEGFMYRFQPQITVLQEKIAGGVIGEVLKAEASFCFDAGFDPQSRLFNPELGGGAIWDVGCYPASASRMIAGWVESKPFAEPVSIQAAGKKNASGVDLYSDALLTFSSGLQANLSCAVGLKGKSELWIYGREGRIFVPEPWQPGRASDQWEIFLLKGDQKELLAQGQAVDLFATESDAFAEAVFHGEVELSAMSHDDSLGNMQVLEEWISRF